MYPKKYMTDEELIAYDESDEFLNDNTPPMVTITRTPLEILQSALERRNNATAEECKYEERGLTRIILQVKVLNHCTWEEIAEVLEMNINDVVRRYGRLAQELQERLKSDDIE